MLGSGLADAGQDVPSSVRDAVRACLSRLEADERELLDRLSQLPGEVPTWLMQAWLPVALSAAQDPCQARGLLVPSDTGLNLRHALARRATAEAVPAARRRALHAELLLLLSRPPAGSRAVALSQRQHHVCQVANAAQVRAGLRGTGEQLPPGVIGHPVTGPRTRARRPIDQETARLDP
ncbi:hypothetical protein OOZ63_17110 [Paucibacter sp. PLA-PC-4]|uniref:hypothetical protein n=1 Tax=Paucibacter sp. PLA-PC-4 TaxID=2993655 RepID=UPI00224A8125|nr:hypothetical protein [Paucibacter sp. PLA-PC-4]MCX2863553.1 hypothetical protein [Paucibacter sp. PLA-PC-4]